MRISSLEYRLGKPMQALVKARLAYGDVAAQLSDEGVDLSTLVE